MKISKNGRSNLRKFLLLRMFAICSFVYVVQKGKNTHNNPIFFVKICARKMLVCVCVKVASVNHINHAQWFSFRWNKHNSVLAAEEWASFSSIQLQMLTFFHGIHFSPLYIQNTLLAAHFVLFKKEFSFFSVISYLVFLLFFFSF